MRWSGCVLNIHVSFAFQIHGSVGLGWGNFCQDIRAILQTVAFRNDGHATGVLPGQGLTPVVNEKSVTGLGSNTFSNVYPGTERTPSLKYKVGKVYWPNFRLIDFRGSVEDQSGRPSVGSAVGVGGSRLVTLQLGRVGNLITGQRRIGASTKRVVTLTSYSMTSELKLNVEHLMNRTQGEAR